MKKLIAGNWKMNGGVESARTLAAAIAEGLRARRELLDHCDYVVCPPAVHMGVVQSVLQGAAAPIALGAQDCGFAESGAYTGDVSASMLKDFGCNYVIIGHSERRQYYQESNERVARKAALAHANGLISIICVGETESQRAAGEESDVVENQLIESIPSCATSENTVIAYEPVWAIGTGKTATTGDVGAMHAFIRRRLQESLADSSKVRILYGGSVKPENAAELLAVPDVDGALIGGASLKADQYLAIARGAAAKSGAKA